MATGHVEARSVLDAAKRWVDRCLRRDGSLFDVDGEIWTLANLGTIRQRFTEDPDESGDPFLTKLSRQLEGADDDVFQLMAEFLYVHLLVPMDIGGTAKRDNIQAVLSWAERDIQLPGDLDEALDSGLVKSGVAYKTYRPQQLWLLIDFTIALKELDGEGRTRLLEDPWDFKEFLFDIPFEAAYAQREAILYLVHPETFEDIISRDHKKHIIEGLGEFAGDTDDVDRALLAIRTHLENEAGGPISFYESEYRARWDPNLLEAWDGLGRWAPLYVGQPGWDAGERDYKIETAATIAEVRQTIGRDDDWPGELCRRINRHSNLVDFRVLDNFRQWMEDDRERAAGALSALWDDRQPLAERIDGFAEQLGSGLSARGAALSLASVLLMADDPTGFPPYRQLAVQSYFDLCRREHPPGDASNGEWYRTFLDLCDEVIQRLAERDVHLRDRLDAQSVLWSLAKADAKAEPISSLSEGQRHAFLKWRGDELPEAGIDESVDEALGDDVARRTRRIRQILDVWRATNDEPASSADEDQNGGGEDAVQLLADLSETSDLEAFIQALRGSPHVLPHTTSGSHILFLRGIAQHADDLPSAAQLVADAYRAPADENESIRKIEALADLADRIGTRSYPASGMAPLAASAFWYVQETSWPWLSAAAEAVLLTWGWLGQADGPGERYLAYRECLNDISAADSTAIRALAAMNDGWTPGLDPTLVERSHENRLLRQNDQPSKDDQRRSYVNARTVVGDLKLFGQALRDDVGTILAREVQVIPARAQPTSIGTYRADGFVALRPMGVPSPAPDLRIWVISGGIGIGLYPGQYGDWYAEARRIIEEKLPEDMEFYYSVWSGGLVRDLAPDPASDVGPGATDFLVGRWYPGIEGLARPELVDDVLAIARLFRPAFEQLIQAVGGTPRPRIDVSDDPLAAEVSAFVSERDYPDARAREARSERVRLARALQPALLEHQVDPELLSEIIDSSSYGRLTDRALRERALQLSDGERREQLRGAVRELLWGDGDDADRIDLLLTDDDANELLDEELAVKLLAITRPDRYLPLLRMDGADGKRRLLERLGLDAPPQGETKGAQHVAANDQLRTRLEEFFPGDTLGMAEFLQWYASREEAPADEDDRVAAAASELLVDEDWLREVVDLLYEKRQVIFYGPPGTGKTYVARRLAQALVRDEERYRLVQFHPSYAYEDFFEGYRPVTDRGQMRYELRPGPLAEMVEQAFDAPGADHVMVIDEINRANLPKVFGELLYLLEYRDDAIQTQYRDRPSFTLPKRLYFIGTMNTADRSIALVDAALRRRFHFVPFFPHEGEVAGLLRRWLQENDEPEWIADFLDFVNERLRDDLGGPHLQVGPSHFMRHDIEDHLRRVWRFSVFPYIEEQLFGDERTIERYSFDVVEKEFQQVAGPTVVESSGEAAAGPWSGEAEQSDA